MSDDTLTDDFPAATEPTPLDAEPALARETPRMGLPALAVDTLRRPAAAMRRLADHPGRRWIWPLGLLALVRVVLVFAQAEASQAYSRAATQAAMAEQFENNPEMAAQMSASMDRFGLIGTVFGAVGGFVGVFLAALIVAGILHFIGTVMGGQQSFTQAFTVTSWAHLPLVIGALAQLAYALTGGYDPCPRGLSGLVCPDPSDPGSASYWSPLLAQIELWNLWYLLLLGIGVQAVSRVTRRKAALAVAVIVALAVGLGMAGTALGRAMSGFVG